MKRKQFLKNSLLGLGSIRVFNHDVGADPKHEKACVENDDCLQSPRETAGPFPNKTPAELVRANIVGDRIGVPLLTTLTIQDLAQGCKPMQGVLVDIWYCDKDGKYSEYGSQKSAHFLRGRQTTDGDGQVSFIGVYPGWYPGRAPHLHIEILDPQEQSLLITQIAFPSDITDTVYALNEYRGEIDTTNRGDGVFRNSLDANMADAISGNLTDGYSLIKIINV